MARYRMCRDCGGRGKVKCWYCRGAGFRSRPGNPPDTDVEDNCPQCVDGTEVCEACSGDGGWYNE